MEDRWTATVIVVQSQWRSYLELTVLHTIHTQWSRITEDHPYITASTPGQIVLLKLP